jgi:hypothetical protein
MFMSIFVRDMRRQLKKFSDAHELSEVLERITALEAKVAEIDEPSKGSMIPDRAVALRYGVSVRTLERWDKTPDSGFPKAIMIRRRRYRRREALDLWDKKCARRGRRDRDQDLPRADAGRFKPTPRGVPKNTASR